MPLLPGRYECKRRLGVTDPLGQGREPEHLHVRDSQPRGFFCHRRHIRTRKPRGGTAVAGRGRQPCGSCGTSAMDYRPRPSLWSSRVVSRPQAWSQATQRARSVPARCTARRISPPTSGLVWQVTAGGTPQRRRRSADVASSPHSWGQERRRANRGSPWRLAEPKHTPP